MTIDSTPPNPSVRYAGFWIRFWAFVVDSVLLTLVLVAIGLFVYDANLFDTSRRVAPTQEFVMSFALPAMIVLVFWIRGQATPGKLMVHARIVDARTGAEPTVAQLVVRYFGYYLSMFGLGLGFLWVAFDRRKQGWHDKLAGTVVIRGPDDADRPVGEA